LQLEREQSSEIIPKGKVPGNGPEPIFNTSLFIPGSFLASQLARKALSTVEFWFIDREHERERE
jgi:hypothetical protein